MGVYFNKKRTLRQYAGLMKYFVKRFFVSLPYRITARKRKLPDFLIIGAMKGGTSSLYDWIGKHPDVALSREQEVHFFSVYYRKGLNYYRSFFPKKSTGKFTGESSPYYLYHPLVPERVKKDVPRCKIIVVLRDPVLRAYSHYQMHKGIDVSKNFDEALQNESDRVASAHERFLEGKDGRSTSHQAFSYIGRGQYHEQLSRWLQHYSLDELLVLKSETLYEQPMETMQRVFQFLGLRDFDIPELQPVNQRGYQALSEEDYDKYAVHFREDGRKLAELLGPEFKWKCTS